MAVGGERDPIHRIGRTHLHSGAIDTVGAGEIPIDGDTGQFREE